MWDKAEWADSLEGGSSLKLMENEAKRISIVYPSTYILGGSGHSTNEWKKEWKKKSYGEKYYWTWKNLLSCIVKRMAIIWKIIKVLFYENTFDVLKCSKTWLLLDSKGNISRMLHPNMKTIETRTGISKLNVYKKWNRERRKNGNKCERILISSIRLKGVSLL